MSKLVTKAVVDPVHAIMEAADGIAKGNINVDVNYKGTDEMGELAEAFHQTCETLRVIINDLKYMLDDSGTADFCNQRTVICTGSNFT